MMKVENGDFKIKGGEAWKQVGGLANLAFKLTDYKLCGVADL